MSICTYLPAHRAWEFFLANEDALEEMSVLVAENKDTGFSLLMTNLEGFPYFIVKNGSGVVIHKEEGVNDKDCDATVTRCIISHLIAESEDTMKDEEEAALFGEPPFEEQDEQDEDVDLGEEEIMAMIDDRENELEDAFLQFLRFVLVDDFDKDTFEGQYGKGMLASWLDDILEHMATGWEVPIYRPTYIVLDEEEIFSEYPYNPDMEVE